MGEHRHTPGLWVLGEEGETFVQVWASDARIVTTARGSIITGNTDEMLANARLIAAAPELLEALEGLLAATESSEGVPAANAPCEEGCSMCTAQIAARTAIAKARGTR